jgi:hypothetical protein
MPDGNIRPLMRGTGMTYLLTEPAFARLLRLPGDPYQAVLELEPRSDEDLRQLLKARTCN